MTTIKEWCETCEGLGEGLGVEQGPNGPIERNDVKCPDCSGHGYIEYPKRPPVINISCEIREDEMIGTTSLNVIRVEPEDDGSWTAVTDYWPGTELPKVQWSRELPTIQGWYWVRPMTSHLGTPTLRFLSRGYGLYSYDGRLSAEVLQTGFVKNITRIDTQVLLNTGYEFYGPIQPPV